MEPRGYPGHGQPAPYHPARPGKTTWTPQVGKTVFSTTVHGLSTSPARYLKLSCRRRPGRGCSRPCQPVYLPWRRGNVAALLEAGRTRHNKFCPGFCGILQPVFARLGLQLGAQKVIDYAGLFGLDNQSVVVTRYQGIAGRI